MYRPRYRRARGFWAFGLVVLSVLALTAIACGVSVLETETRSDTFNVGSSPRLVVNGFNGSIVVNAEVGDVVRVEAELRDPARIEYSVTQDGNTITVEAKMKLKLRINIGPSPGVNIDVKIPSATKVELRTSNSSIEVVGIHESGKVSTSNGNIVMQDVTGDFDVDTSNGSVTVRRGTGAFDIETSNGRIDFSGELVPDGRNRMTTSNDSVTVTLEGEPSVKVDISTSNGSVAVGLPVLTTSLGDKNRLSGTIGDGEADLVVRTSNGSVTIN